MAVEEFTWCARIDGTSTPEYRVRTSKFGDGYEQVAGDGLNNRSDSWALTFAVGEKAALEIKAFLDRHGGFKSFLWTPPLGELGFYRSTAPTVTSHGADRYTLTATFTTAFQP
ncbi:phage tail protein [Pseudomonas baltica]|uniref:Phage tail protein n=1 Tax=Pseudomonas baltica TaxID=2762576 RepID=A0A7X1G8T9_9PSED|nr:phage tail protein [Pseudomonas baltica]MBC2680630.1 phage tail protein [Pseudomonas baltica]